MVVYRHNNGKWYCQFMIKGERIHKLLDGAKNKEEAKELEDAERFKIRQIQNGLLKEDKRSIYNFEFLMKKYIYVSEANNKSVREAKIYAKYLSEYFGKVKDIEKIKPSDIEKFKLYMLKKKRSKATINRYLAALKRAYNILISDGLININPINKVKKLDEDNKRYRYLTKEEWLKLKQYLPPNTLNIVIFALQTGFRKRNVLECRWEQVDFNLRTIELLKQQNKGKKVIKIPISDVLYELLLSLKPKKSGYIFVNPDTGKPYTNIRKSFDTALKKAGIEDFHFHDLRRTVGTWLLTSGVDLRTIQNILAHSDISTTERYLSLTPEQNRKAINVLNSYI